MTHKVINATPHAINIVWGDGHPLLTLPVSGMVLRCATSTAASAPVILEGPVAPNADSAPHTWEEWGTQAVIPVTSTVYGAVEVQGGGEVPAPQEGVLYVVSALVRLAAPDRADFLSPGPLVRDADGKPVGCQGLSR